MAEIEIGDALASGFGLIRRQPLAVLLWGLVYLVATAVVAVVLGPVYGDFLGTVVSQAGHFGAAPDMAAFTQKMARFQGLSLLLDLAMAFVGVVIYCAVFRAILHPERKRFGYLRVGMAELFVLVLLIAGYIAVGVFMVAAILLVGLIVAILVATHAIVAAVIVGVLAVLALVIGLIYLCLRFSLVGPMIVHDGRFHLIESWTATKGRTVSLFIIGACLVMILLIAEAVVGMLLLLIGLGLVGSAAGGLQNLPVFIHQPPGLLLTRLTPALAVFAIVWTPLVGCAMAIGAAPWARAYQDIVGPDVVAEFA